jgi:chloramphenicol 3-O-phosphotransferase
MHSMERAVILVSGTQGAGKSTVARALAMRFNRGVHIEADLLQRLIVSGGAAVTPPEPQGEAKLQLRLRARHAAMLADSFFLAGFTVVIDDIAIGSRLNDFREDIRSRPLMLVNLAPSVDVVEQRNLERPNKNVFHPWGPLLDREMRTTMQGLGLWIDNSNQSVEETVDEILRRCEREAVLE